LGVSDCGQDKTGVLGRMNLKDPINLNVEAVFRVESEKDGQPWRVLLQIEVSVNMPYPVCCIVTRQNPGIGSICSLSPGM
ncbi:hypothetical protein HispidOSU_010511, partial [Sigmodon hispidus]